MNKSTITTVLGAVLLAATKRKGSGSSEYMTDEQFNVVKFDTFGSLAKFGLDYSVHQKGPEEWLELSSIALRRKRKEKTQPSNLKITKEQVFQLYVLDLMNSDVLRLILDHYEYLYSQYTSEIVELKTDFDKRLSSEGGLEKFYKAFYIEPYSRIITLQRGDILYSGLTTDVTNEEILAFNDSFWCSHSASVALGFKTPGDPKYKVVQYRIAEDMVVQEMDPFTYKRVLGYQILLHYGFWHSIDITTYEDRKEIRELVCGMGLDGYYIEDYYSKTDFFRPNDSSFLNLEYLHNSSDFLVCSPEKLDVINILSNIEFNISYLSAWTGNEGDADIIAFYDYDDYYGNSGSFIVDRAVSNGQGYVMESLLRNREFNDLYAELYPDSTEYEK